MTKLPKHVHASINVNYPKIRNGVRFWLVKVLVQLAQRIGKVKMTITTKKEYK